MSYTTEKGIQVRTYPNLCRFFNYDEVRSVILGKNIGDLFDILEDFITDRKDEIEHGGERILYDLFGTPVLNKTQTNTSEQQEEKYNKPPKTPKELFEKKEYQSIFPLLQDRNSIKSVPSLDLEGLCNFLYKICIDTKCIQHIHSEVSGITGKGHLHLDLNQAEEICNNLYKDYRDVECIQHIHSEVSSITGKGHLHLSLDQAYEIIIFCALFVWIRRIPEERDVTQLKDHLNLNTIEASEQILKKTNEIVIQEKVKVLPYFQGQSCEKPLNLELAVISNQLDVPVVVQLDSCPLLRHLGAREKMLALTTDGKVVTFLPRFCAAQSQLILQHGSKLQPYDDSKDFVQLDEDDTVFFGESQEYGLLIANQEGTFISTKDRFKGDPPKQKIVWLQGDLRDYAFLDNNGNYIGRTRKRNWKNLLFFDISVGNGIAVTADRRAIDANGNTLSHQAVAVSCCGERYIILRIDGTVLTDKGEISRPDFPARAVCADAYGYWIATENTLYCLYESEESLDYCIEEISRNNSGTVVYGVLSNGSFCQLC